MTDLAANKSQKDAAQDLVTGKEPVVPGTRVERLRAYWLSPAGLLIATATVLALVLRCFIFTQSSFLTSGSIEYDDGVYLGSAIRLLQGILPYKDYAFLQPPGILIVSLPFAVIAKLASAKLAMAAARVATAIASALCVALAGNLVRHRGAFVTAVTCGLLAVYPADIMAGRTLLLEPWMNLCCLLAATAAFRAGLLASPRRLALAGVALGFAATIKFWAAIPAAVLLAVILLVPAQRWARARWYVLAVAGGFLVPVAAFAASVPLGFLRDTLLYQATRVGESTPLAVRLDHLSGLSLVLAAHGLAITPSSYTLFQADSTASMEPTSVGLLLPLVVTIAAAALIVFPYARWRRDRSPLEWFALATAVVAAAAILSYSAFFYHYPAFPAPWLAIAGGVAAGALAQALTTTERAPAGRSRPLSPSWSSPSRRWRSSSSTACTSRATPMSRTPSRRARAWSATRSRSPSASTGSPPPPRAAPTWSTHWPRRSRSATGCRRRAGPGTDRRWCQAGRLSSARPSSCGSPMATRPAYRGHRS